MTEQWKQERIAFLSEEARASMFWEIYQGRAAVYHHPVSDDLFVVYGEPTASHITSGYACPLVAIIPEV